MLDAALERTYSGDPGETFFTGGGAHHFVNFEPEEDHQVFTVRKALWHSVNLVFIRLMRDVVHHAIYGELGVDPAVLTDEDNPRRQQYLARFADDEGAEFLVRYYRQYSGRPPDAVEALLRQQLRPAPTRLAAAFYGVQPTGDLQQLARFIEQRTGKRPDERELKALEAKYGPGRWSLADRAFIAGVHPLELWVAGYLRHYPNATWTQTLGASHQARQDAYAWLFKTHNPSAQNVRIREVIEQDGFAKILADWKRLGYPFDSITPSYATALGASGDRPAALADLMGILVNRGLKLPTVRVGSLDFAKHTPYETAFQLRPGAAQRMMPSEVADAVLDAAQGVMKEGTASRLNGVFRKRDGSVVPIGGKTGTGDHRYDVFGPGGTLISSRVIDRSGTLVFYIGDRYFGTMMVYAHEPYAARFKFTSALPAQLLKALAPTLLPLLDDQRTCPALPMLATAVVPPKSSAAASAPARPGAAASAAHGAASASRAASASAAASSAIAASAASSPASKPAAASAASGASGASAAASSAHGPASASASHPSARAASAASAASASSR
jgi:membrane peptidoglycan carboxypeptidase